jgi:acetamidase/formamidase
VRTVAAIIYLPVNVDGALLYLGDCRAAQGDGELCGVAVEHPTVTTVQIDLIKGWPVKGPRLETPDAIMTIGSAKPMEDAARIAYRKADALQGNFRRFKVGNENSPELLVKDHFWCLAQREIHWFQPLSSFAI